MFYICCVVFPRCISYVLSLYGNVFMFQCFFYASCFNRCATCYMQPPLQTKNHANVFMSPLLRLAPLTMFELQGDVLCHRGHAWNVLALGFAIWHARYGERILPFPLSSSPRVKLTFPASRLYLNSEHQRLMVPRKSVIINAFHLSDLIRTCRRSC